MIVDQILVDGFGVPALAEREFDEIEVWFAGAGRGATAWSRDRLRVGGHLIGRFCWRAPTPTSRCTDRHTRSFQIGTNGLSPDAGLLLDAP